MITSQVEAKRIDGDLELSQWTDAGLLHPSLLRLAKVDTVDGDLVEKVIGKLSDGDAKSVRKAFQRLVAAWLR